VGLPQINDEPSRFPTSRCSGEATALPFQRKPKRGRRVRAEEPRHIFTSLGAQYGFRDDVTFYTRHGDIFAWLCAIVAIAAIGSAVSISRSKRSA